MWGRGLTGRIYSSKARNSSWINGHSIGGSESDRREMIAIKQIESLIIKKKIESELRIILSKQSFKCDTQGVYFVGISKILFQTQ